MRSYRGHTGDIHSVLFTPDGRYAVTAADDKKIKVWAIAHP